MRSLSSFARGAALACALLAFAVGPVALAQDNPQGPKVSDGEAKLGDKIQNAPDAAAKLSAAEEFLKKYPKSPLRPQIANYLSGQILLVADNAQKGSLAAKYLGLFTETSEGVHLAPVVVDEYVRAQRFDDAFKAGAAWLAKAPDDPRVLAVLAFHGIDQARRNNAAYVAQAQQYLPKAVALLEAGTKPAGADAAHFDTFKAAWLPQLYQVQAVIAIGADKYPEAIERAQKAIALSPRDPVNYYIVGSAKDREYERMATQYRAMAEGPPKNEMLGKINATMDEVIDYYARTVAAAEGNEPLKGLREQVLQDMTNYYKFRHNGSTDGLQQLIDKYKQPAPPAP